VFSEVESKYITILKTLNDVKDVESELMKLEKWLESEYESEMLENEAKMDNALELYKILDYRADLDRDQTLKVFKIQIITRKIEESWRRCKNKRIEFKNKLSLKLIEEIKEFYKKLDELKNKIAQVKKSGN